MVTKKKSVKSTSKKTAKKVFAKHSTSKSEAPMKSFRVYKDVKPFTTFTVTRQTVYWAILLAFIIVTQLWILKIQMDIANLTSIVISR
jgi:hypothetical protein